MCVPLHCYCHAEALSFLRRNGCRSCRPMFLWKYVGHSCKSVPSKQKFSGTQHHFKQTCGTAFFVDMSSLATLVQQAEAGGRNEKNLHERREEAFFRDGHTLGACYKHILLDSTFLIHQNPFRMVSLVVMLKP